MNKPLGPIQLRHWNIIQLIQIVQSASIKKTKLKYDQNCEDFEIK